MTDTDREAGNSLNEIWKAEKHCGDYGAASFWFEKGWQVAQTIYAPKLTFREAIEKAGDAVEKLVSRGKYPGDSEFDYALEMAAAALRAAGVRFKEPGDGE